MPASRTGREPVRSRARALRAGAGASGWPPPRGHPMPWSDPQQGLSAVLRGRGLLGHAAKGFRQRGIAGALSWGPSPAPGRGLQLTLSRTPTGLAAYDTGDEQTGWRFEARFGYGFAAFGNRFTSKPEVGFGVSNARREFGRGWLRARGGSCANGGQSFDFSVVASRFEAANEESPPEHEVGRQLDSQR